MKLAISNIAWDKLENDVVYSILRKYKIDGLEIAPTKLFEKNPYLKNKAVLQNLKQEILSQKLRLVSMQSILFGRSDLKLFESEEKRKEMIEYLKQGILFAKELGIENIVFGNPKNRISFAKNDREIALSFFKELGSFAFENDVIIGIEANPTIYGCNFLTGTKDTIDFINELETKGIGLNLDIGTMLVNREKIDILKNISAEKISHVHISEPYLNKINVENREFHKNILRFLKGKNYFRYISIEMKQQPIREIEQVIKYLSELNKEVENE